MHQRVQRSGKVQYAIKKTPNFWEDGKMGGFVADAPVLVATVDVMVLKNGVNVAVSC